MWGSQSEILYLGHLFKDSNPGGYDCLVAISGGRDSSFAAYYAVKQMDLKVLGYTLDNGFMPEETKRNVRRIIDILGIDHVYHTPGSMKRYTPHLIRAWIAAPSPAAIPLFCTGCRSGYESGIREIARQHHIRFVITGAGEPQESFAERLLAGDSRGGIISRKDLMQGFIREIMHNPRYLLNPRCLGMMAEEFRHRYRLRGKPSYETAPVFRYLAWNEELLMDVITNKLDWKAGDHTSSSWRSDCQIHVIRQYLYREMLGFTKNDDMLACLIREGHISREEAIQRLESENQISEDYLTEVLAGMGLDFQDLKAAVEHYKARNPRPTGATLAKPALQD